MPPAGNSWIGLLAWFPAQVPLQDGLCGFLDSLIKLCWEGLCTTYRWDYELAHCLGRGAEWAPTLAHLVGDMNMAEPCPEGLGQARPLALLTVRASRWALYSWSCRAGYTASPGLWVGFLVRCG